LYGVPTSNAIGPLVGCHGCICELARSTVYVFMCVIDFVFIHYGYK